ncbi:MAG: hypothetical protein II826_03050 [Prevotella sp.]|nr:hypothetical protein [Prevotella sp.]
MEKRIFVDQKGHKQLQAAFPHLSRISIWNALTYKTDSSVARKIRFVAITQCGGVMRTGECASWEWETEHNEVEKTMVQTFGPHFKLVLYKETGVSVVYIDGEEKRRDKGLGIPEWEALQVEVEQMARRM